MVLEHELDRLEEVFLGDALPAVKLELLFDGTRSGDYLLRHKSYYLLKEMKEQRAVPFILKRLTEKDLPEEDVLRLMDIASELKKDTALVFRRFLRHKNPYLVRGALTAMAKCGSGRSLKVILGFAGTSKGGIIRRELFSELIGYMFDLNPDLRTFEYSLILSEPPIRGYLRDMEIQGPKYKRLSVYPSNDYWALKARARGIDYGLFKYRVESIRFKKI